ncbi:VWA domain-containing protein [Streptomyces paludis]|uniref:VWA domain-containing protein n=2 Tax=Streptomyces paludis TaxID=2282738 RepID=A0A345I0I4_9ACTN|nr:VWA domain-containing protein [Streptomyces paludis]
MLAEAAPEVLFVELPEEFAPWLPYLADPATVEPVALAGARGGAAGGGLVFLPFAEFSPELAAIRWARDAGVEVVPFDLPLAAREPERDTEENVAPAECADADSVPVGSLAAALRARAGGRPGDDLWDRLVEAPAPGSTPESLRRAALLVGWALRRDAGTVTPYDLRREANMRRVLAPHTGRRAAALIGAFHAPALLPESADPGAGGEPRRRERVVVSAAEAERTAPGSAVGAAAGSAAGAPASAGQAGPAGGAVLAAGREAGPTGRTGGPDGNPAGPGEASGASPDAGTGGEVGSSAGTGGAGGNPAGPGGASGTSRTGSSGGTLGSEGNPTTPGGALGTSLGAGVGGVVTSLVPYSYALLDERSGYPAGIRDPEWQRGVFRAGGDPGLLDELLTVTAVRICAAVRDAGHPSGPVDAREVVRVARDLAALRGLPAAGRGELAEAAQTVLTQGQLLGRGRVVAAAMEKVLVGSRRGALAPGTPRSGLGPAVEALLGELSLPGPAAPARRELRLDAHRGELDRRRELCLRRLAACRVPYGEESEVAGVGDAAALTTRWAVAWSPSTAAMLDVAGVHGVTLDQAASGALRQRWASERRSGGPTSAETLDGLADAARCGLPVLAAERLAETAALLPASGTLPELLAALALLDRVRSGHLPGLPPGWEKTALDAAYEELAAAGVRALDGLAGSTDPDDARALVSLADRAAALGGGLRLDAALKRLDEEGTALVRGAAGAARVLLGRRDAAEFGTRLASRVDGATDPARRTDLAGFLSGTLLAAGPLLEAGPALDPLLERVEALSDRGFLDRLPSLRAGFDTLSPAARARLLAMVEDRTGHAAGALPAALAAPADLALLAAADLAGREALAARGYTPPPEKGGDPESRGEVASAASSRTGVGQLPAGGPPPLPSSHALAPWERWRLLLGRSRELTGGAARIAGALDELYGYGRGEGARGEESAGSGSRGGTGPSYPDVRSWSEELSALFGPGVREEVLAAAADAGRLDAALELDPAAARPSVELLRTVLSYAGGLPERQLARLRPLVARLVAELTAALANRLRPALTGLAHPRPTRRPGGPLDLSRTLRANLATARRDPATGVVSVLPERPVFRTRARRSADWRLVLVTDVSGSMEASTVWAALTAAVLAGVPTVSTHFVAFSTEVLDLTDQVEDPLSLLLEVRVGGGTNIARGLRHARGLVTVPSRTLIVLISDFEEGGPVAPLLAEVRALVDAGCHVLGCASLDNEGRPRYSTGVAGQLVGAGMPVAALSPLELARWVGERVGGAGR